MTKTILIRKIHFWVSLVVILPLFLVTTTGLTLMLKKQLSWVQATEIRGTKKVPSLSFNNLLQALSKEEHSTIQEWSDIARIDVRPSKGIAKVITHSPRQEIQVDMATGTVLKITHRNSDLIEDLHTGDFFGPWVKFGIFFTAEVLFFIQLLTGIYLFFLPFFKKRKRKDHSLN